jgi:hypothetical protein
MQLTVPTTSHYPDLDLTPVFTHGVGYHGAAWIDLSDGIVSADRLLLPPLDQFVATVADMAETAGIDQRVGVAYMRVIDGSEPENYMRWHRDNPDGAVRFHTAIATDNAQVNLSWLVDDDLIGFKVTDTEWPVEGVQPPNGDVTMFTTEAHGVLPQPVRPGQFTAIFFATLYTDRLTADLYTTNNTQTGSHAMLPTLEQTRTT